MHQRQHAADRGSETAFKNAGQPNAFFFINEIGVHHIGIDCQATFLPHVIHRVFVGSGDVFGVDSQPFGQGGGKQLRLFHIVVVIFFRRCQQHVIVPDGHTVGAPHAG